MSRLLVSTIHYPLSTIACLLLLTVGCSRPDSSSDAKPAAKPLEGLKLRLAVVDDPALAAAVVRVQGEWNTQTGAELQVDQITEKDLTQAEALSADAAICPSHLLSVLAERGLLAPVPARIMRDAEWTGIFDLLKLREAAWGAKIVAVPFGSPVLTCYYRADLLEKLNRRPPRTWTEYQELASLLAKKGREERGEGQAQNSPRPNGEGPTKKSPRPLGEGQAKKSPRPLGEGQGVRASWCGTIEPLAPGWAGLVLLARAASYAKHRDNYSAIFDIETMEPLIAGPPFVQALEELVAAAKLGPSDPFAYDPAAARAAFWKGQCGMALTWPTAADEEGVAAGLARRADRDKTLRTQTNGEIRVGFAELPGSQRVFNLSGRAWDNRADDEDGRVPLLAIAGRLGVVSKKSAHADAAFQLLLWLSDSSMSPQVSAASPATTLFRQSNLKSPGQWVEKPVSAAAALKYGDAAEAALSHEQWLGALRLPGRAEYIAALDEAVAAAVRGKKAPMEALLQAEAKWRKITERLGLERQKSAYRHSLGLE